MSDLGEHSPLRYGPPPASPPPTWPAGPPTPGPRHTSRLPRAAWPLVVLVASVAAGAVVGLAVGYATLAAASDADGWAELGAFIFGAVVGLVAFGAAYVAGLVLAGRRAFPPGRRTVPVTLALGLPVAFVLLVMVLNGVVASLATELTPAVGIVAGLAVLAAGPLAFAWSDTAAGLRRLLVAAGVMGAVVLMVAGAGVGADRVRTNRVVAQLPLVLFDGQTAQAPFQGWRHTDSSQLSVAPSSGTFTDRGHSAHLTYLTPTGIAYVAMHTEVGPCQTTEDYSCRVVGSLKGNEERVYTRNPSYTRYLRSPQFVVVVHADGSAVSVSGVESRRAGVTAVTSPEQVLERLVRVDRRTFERETGTTLRVR